MKVTLDRINDAYLFEGKSKTGTSVFINDSSEEGAKGAGPMELILMGVGGCSAMDMVSILKKQKQEIESFHIEVEGKRMELQQARPFKAILVKIFLKGTIAPNKAKRAGQLSFEKYCSVSLSLQPCVEVTYEIVLNGESVT